MRLFFFSLSPVLQRTSLVSCSGTKYHFVSSNGRCGQPRQKEGLTAEGMTTASRHEVMQIVGDLELTKETLLLSAGRNVLPKLSALNRASTKPPLAVHQQDSAELGVSHM